MRTVEVKPYERHPRSVGEANPRGGHALFPAQSQYLALTLRCLAPSDRGARPDMVGAMRVGVYVDGYNLYYGARQVCGRSTPGWRWLDVRSLAEHIIHKQRSWQGATVDRVVYCTARVDSNTNRSAFADQDVYLKALQKGHAVDHIEYGNYVARVKQALLADTDPITRKPAIRTASWPVMVRDQTGSPVPNATFMVQYLHLEEKGSDVNVAAHLLVDVLSEAVDAAMVISNDSDLAYPIREARKLVPVATVNPRSDPTAGKLKGSPTDGVGGHWWWKTQAAAYYASQLPDPCGGQTKPIGW